MNFIGGTPNRYLKEKREDLAIHLLTELLAVFLWVVYSGYCSEFNHRWSCKKKITWKNELKVIAKSPTWKIYNNSVSLYLLEISNKYKSKDIYYYTYKHMYGQEEGGRDEKHRRNRER